MIRQATSVPDIHIALQVRDTIGRKFIQIYMLCKELCMCQKNQPSLKTPTMPLQPPPVITKVWFRVGMDLTGPLIESQGYLYILTFIDHFTKWIVTSPLKTKTRTM